MGCKRLPQQVGDCWLYECASCCCRFDVMPILTPAYPSMNSSYAVSRSTLNIMQVESSASQRIQWLACWQMEFQRGHAKAEKAMATGGKEAWDDLFEESDFFIRFSHYFAITVSAATETNFDSWTGCVRAAFAICDSWAVQPCWSTTAETGDAPGESPTSWTLPDYLSASK